MTHQTCFLIIIVLFLLGLIVYCIMNFSKILKHYKCGIKFDENNKILFLNDRKIKINDIKNVDINEDIQDFTITERWFYGDTGRLIVDQLIFKLIDGSEEIIYTNRRCQLYSVLKKLKKYINIEYDINLYKEPILTTYEKIMSLLIILIYIAFFRHIFSIPIFIIILLFVYFMQRGDYLYK